MGHRGQPRRRRVQNGAGQDQVQVAIFVEIDPGGVWSSQLRQVDARRDECPIVIAPDLDDVFGPIPTSQEDVQISVVVVVTPGSTAVDYAWKLCSQAENATTVIVPDLGQTIPTDEQIQVPIVIVVTPRNDS